MERWRTVLRTVLRALTLGKEGGRGRGGRGGGERERGEEGAREGWRSDSQPMKVGGLVSVSRGLRTHRKIQASWCGYSELQCHRRTRDSGIQCHCLTSDSGIQCHSGGGSDTTAQ